MDNINTFEINKTWFSYVAENVNVKPIHTALYFFIFNKWNSLFWKKQFGLPTDNTMQCLNIRSYKTYIKALNDLESFGFIKFIERAKNQNTSNIVEMVNNTKADTKATTKAMLKATTQSDYQSDVQSSVSIVKHFNKEQINLLTKKHKEVKEFLLSLNSDKPKGFDFKQSLLDLGIEKQIVDDWILVRKNKKASNTETSFTKIKNQIEKTKLTPSQCIRIAVERDWKGFEADWVKDIKPEKEDLFDRQDYDVPNDAIWGLSEAEIKKRCLSGEFKKRV